MKAVEEIDVSYSVLNEYYEVLSNLDFLTSICFKKKFLDLSVEGINAGFFFPSVLYFAHLEQHLKLRLYLQHLEWHMALVNIC